MSSNITPIGGGGGGAKPPTGGKGSSTGGGPPSAPPRANWFRLIAKKPNGQPIGDERNIGIALQNAPELRRLLQYNEFSDRIEMRRPLPTMPKDITHETLDDYPPLSWQDEHSVDLMMWMQAQGMLQLRKNMVHDVVVMTAKRNPYHPLKDYLEDVRWDGTHRLGTWLSTYLGARDPAAYLAAIGPKFLIGAVARAMRPGCQMDTILVLEGDQGKGKSSAVQILGKHRWAQDITGDLSNKDAAVNIQNVWLGEMAELTSLRRGDQEAVKGFISRRNDHYRPPYGRHSVDRPRHTVFVATTNEYDYLQDPTGGRRLWPAECMGIDLPALERDVDQLWAEAFQLYRDGRQWHLTPEETRLLHIAQLSRQRTTEVDAVVMEYADARLTSGIRTITMRDLLAVVFDINPRVEPAKAGGLATIASRVLVREGWKSEKPTGRGVTRTKTYTYGNDTLRGSEPPTNGSALISSQAHLPIDDEKCPPSAPETGGDDDIPF